MASHLFSLFQSCRVGKVKQNKQNKTKQHRKQKQKQKPFLLADITKLVSAPKIKWEETQKKPKRPIQISLADTD